MLPPLRPTIPKRLRKRKVKHMNKSILVLTLATAAAWSSAQAITGTYSGFSQAMNSDVTMRFSERGQVEARYMSRRTRDIKFHRGTYDSGRISLEGTIFMVELKGQNLQLRESKNSTNLFELRPGNANFNWPNWSNNNNQGSGWGNSNDNNSAQRPPEWVVGQFAGYNRRLDADIDLRINSNGNTSATLRYSNGRRQTQTGTYRDNRFSLGNTWYSLRRTDSGFSAEQTNDKNNWMEYRRTKNTGGLGSSSSTRPPDAPPSWARGVFEGYNAKQRANIEVNLDNRGYLKATVRHRDGRSEVKDGWYRGGKIVIGGVTYTATKTDGGYRLNNVADASDGTNFRKVK